jgi:hypothetical protein
MTPPPAKTVEPLHPSEYYRPCEENGQDRNSDLCAQWTAAHGAQDAAYWAKWSFWVGLVGIGGLLWTLFYTRKAVLAAEKGTRDADAALEHARDSSRRELRAYVLGVDQQIINFAIGRRPTLRVKIKNFGQTPAHELRALTVVNVTRDDPDKHRIRMKKIEGKVSCAEIGPGDFHVFEHTMAMPLTPAARIDYLSGLNIVFAGIISYRDVFGKRHLTTFRDFLPEQEYDHESLYDLATCATGNRSN